MEQLLHDEVLHLTSELERVRHDHRVKRRALLAEIRSKEDALEEWFEDEQASIEKLKAVLVLRIASAGRRPQNSNAIQHELEPVTSSSPDNTLHLLAADHKQQQQQQQQVQQQQHFHQQSGPLALPEGPHDAPSSGHSSHSHSAPDPADASGCNDHPEHEASADSEPINGDGITAPAAGPASENAHADTSPDALQSAEDGESYVEIDVTHVIPVAEQREAGTTTFMMCRPRHKRSESVHANQLVTHDKFAYRACIRLLLTSNPFTWQTAAA